MQKYRRWTDEATGINPFINSKQSTVKLTSIVTSAVIAFIKINVILLLAIPIVLSLLLHDSLAHAPIIGIFVRLPLHVLTVLLGLWGVDDTSFGNWLDRTKGHGKLILSNSVSVLDVFYYLAKIPGVRFIISAQNEENFEVVSGMGAAIRALTNRQPFFTSYTGPQSKKFKQLVSGQIGKGHNCILFYQGIRTNGLGTIKISKKLSSQVYNLQKDYCVAHLKYSSAPEGIFSMVSHPIILFLMALGTLSISLRVRCLSIMIDSQHSQADLQKDLDNFLLANGAKLLETEPASYFDFLNFYGKSQAAGYTHVPQQPKND